MIYENGFEEAVQRRREWTQKALQTVDFGTLQRRLLFNLRICCDDALNSIHDYKNVSTCDIQMDKMESDALASMDSTPPRTDFRAQRSFANLDDECLNLSPETTK
uniref:Uncharacterized protein n=1 Tax=Panagrolaimus sp. PS1159 TaxID=55785 RepID=A0AC35FC62_9BILA